SLKTVSSTLTVVVDDLSRKVAEVSTRMLEAANDSASKSQAVASQVVQNAGAWSEATTKRLETLVGSIESRTQEFAQAGNTLLRANDALKDTLQRNQGALDALSRASEQVKMYSTSLAGLARTADDTQKSQVQAAKLAVQLIEEFRRVSEANASFLTEYKGVFSAYKGVFDGLERRFSLEHDEENKHPLRDAERGRNPLRPVTVSIIRKTSALLFTSQELRVCVHVHGRQRDLKPDPVCAVDSIREHVTVESGHVVWWDMLVFMNSFVNARQLCLTTWCKVDHWGRLVSLLDSTDFDCGEETGESV